MDDMKIATITYSQIKLTKRDISKREIMQNEKQIDSIKVIHKLVRHMFGKKKLSA